MRAPVLDRVMDDARTNFRRARHCVPAPWKCRTGFLARPCAQKTARNSVPYDDTAIVRTKKRVSRRKSLSDLNLMRFSDGNYQGSTSYEQVRAGTASLACSAK